MSAISSCTLPLVAIFAAFSILPLSGANAQHAAMPNTAPATAPQTTATTLWRSDAGIVEAERMISGGHYLDALTVLDQLIARNMYHIEAHAHAALAWYHLGNNDKAKESIKSVQLIDRNHIGSYVILGMIALKEQKLNDASNHLSVIRVLCRSETCPEYQALLRMIRETPPEERKPWYHF